MKIVATLTLLGTMMLAQPAFAQLEAYTDYNVSEATSIVTTVKVDSNMIDYYLEGLKTSWAPSNDVAMELGHIEGYNMYVSSLPESGNFNVVLVVNFKNTGDIGPSKRSMTRLWQNGVTKSKRKAVQSRKHILTSGRLPAAI